MKEHHLKGEFSWPDEYRMAVMMSFDLQGAEGIRPLPDGKIDHEAFAQAEYGPKTGIWRILRILENQNVKATFLTCGAIAERYPESVKAIVAKEHEIAGHGYHHETARNLSKEEEQVIIQRVTDMIKSVSGKRPVGWRSCTQSPNSLELLMEQNYLWNSNSFSYDFPFICESDNRKIAELPRQPFGDGRVYGHRDSGTPHDALMLWKAFFNELYEESKYKPTFCPFQFHPYISSRPGRAQVLAELIQHMKNQEGVWFATGSEIARWVLDHF